MRDEKDEEMRKTIFKLALIGSACSLLSVSQGALCASTGDEAPSRPRLIVLTDIGNEPDDSESLVRLLLYSNEIDIEGLIAATSRHLPNGVHPEMIEERVAAYRSVTTNLKSHDAHYPDADQIQRIIRSGSPVYGMEGVGEGKDTPGSRLIIETVDRSDVRPLWIAVWGGAADLAQALWTVRDTRSPHELARFVAKLRVYSISDQDDAGPWARAYFPSLFWIASIHGFTQYSLGTWSGISSQQPGADSASVSKGWLDANIRGKGPLGAVYPLPSYIMEGDTPSFLHLLPNGLGAPERPDWGGWGGRYDKLSNGLGLWTTTIDTMRGIDGKIYSSPQATIWRWRSAFQNDFAARMLWSITPRFSLANHAPSARLNGKNGIEPVEIRTCPGVKVSLSAKGSRDADGNTVSFRWWQYREASGLFAPSAELSADTGEEISVTVGGTARVDQFTPPRSYPIHIILEVKDNGVPELTSYHRAIISVPGRASSVDGATCAVKPIPPSH